MLLISILLIFSLKFQIGKYLAKYSGMPYAPEFLIIMAAVSCMIMIFYLMTEVTDMQKRIARLIQENSILKDKLEESKR